ncbi:MAG: zf-HC2 domain-containing protein [Actinomycetota bacterium]
MTTTWHADPETMATYVGGELDDVRASSLEAHLPSCDLCRDHLAASVPAAPLDLIWVEVVATIDAPRAGLVERALLALRVPDHAARLLAATPSLRVSWLFAQVVALGFAVLAANQATGQSAELALFLFLVVAALLPVAGVAVAFGPGVDPAYEIGAASPMRADRLLLMRAATVLATSVVISSGAALSMPGLDAIAAAWLLPSLGLTLATLALGTWLRSFVASSSVALGWIALAAAAATGTHDRLAAFRPAAQVVCLVAIAASVAVLAQRHTVYEEGIVS